MAGVALGDIHRRFTWQAWQLGDTHLRFAWQAWCLWGWAGSGDALGPPVTQCGAEAFLRGRHGTWRHPPPFHVAGMALGDTHRRFAWQAWYLCVWRRGLFARRTLT